MPPNSFSSSKTIKAASPTLEATDQQTAQRELNAVVAEAMLAIGLCEPSGLSTAQIAQLAEHIRSTPELTARVCKATAELYHAPLTPVVRPTIPKPESEDFQFRRITGLRKSLIEQTVGSGLKFRSHRAQLVRPIATSTRT